MSEQAGKEPRESIADELGRVNEMMTEVNGRIQEIIKLLDAHPTASEDEEEKDSSALSSIEQQLFTIRGIQRSLHAMHPRLDAIIKEVSKIG